ncbi:MAG: hypothetical protein PHI98_16585 [Eubacteriales bacterium]|nr:hypothetical protein [Eubacteriales bacterium]
MRRLTVDSLEDVSSKMDCIIGAMSLFVMGIGGKTATRQEIAGCAQLVLRAATDCKDDLDNVIGDILDSEVLE